MDPEQKRIKIAEACGWRKRRDHHLSQWLAPVGGAWNEPPDFLRDLNAMHEAEKVMTCDQMEDYADKLQNMCGGNKHIFDCTPVFATAAQRADAFIATLGLDK